MHDIINNLKNKLIAPLYKMEFPQTVTLSRCDADSLSRALCDQQSRIAELEAEVERLKASQTIDGWDIHRWKHEYDIQLYLSKDIRGERR